MERHQNAGFKVLSMGSIKIFYGIFAVSSPFLRLPGIRVSILPTTVSGNAPRQLDPDLTAGRVLVKDPYGRLDFVGSLCGAAQTRPQSALLGMPALLAGLGRTG